MKNFALHDRVSISATGGWKNTFLGTVCSAPEPVETRNGREAFYWIEFDEPQQDVSSELYAKARVLSRFLDWSRG